MNLSSIEAELLTSLAAEGKMIFTTSDARAVWDRSSSIDLVLHRLEQKGWLKRLDRGVYMLIPLEAGPGRTWSASPLVIAPFLIQPAAVAYWSALHYWNLTEQFPRITFVQSTRRKRPLEIQGMRFQFVIIKEERFFGILNRKLDNNTISVTDREKTLIDSADRPDLGGGVVQLALAIKSIQTDMDWPKLDSHLERWGGGAVVKRLGYLLEKSGIAVPDREQRLMKWQKIISRGISLLEPGGEDTGPIVTRWQLRINVEAFSSRSQNDIRC